MISVFWFCKRKTLHISVTFHLFGKNVLELVTSCKNIFIWNETDLPIWGSSLVADVVIFILTSYRLITIESSNSIAYWNAKLQTRKTTLGEKKCLFVKLKNACPPWNNLWIRYAGNTKWRSPVAVYTCAALPPLTRKDTVLVFAYFWRQQLVSIPDQTVPENNLTYTIFRKCKHDPCKNEDHDFIRLGIFLYVLSGQLEVQAS